MELLYNPDAMSVTELKATFVGRELLLEELLELVRSQPEGAGVQHAAIVAPRGMGKTSVLQILRHQVLESELAANWLPLKFPEELYGVADLADFWMETLRLLAIEIDVREFREKTQGLPERFGQRADLVAAAFALLKDFRHQSGKRLLLQVENLDMLFEVISDEQDTARLREVMMNDGTVMLVGSASKFFKQARAYDEPLYNFFRIFNLDRLSFEESVQLLSLRGELDRIEHFSEKLQKDSARLRALHHFTQGIPRLVLMLYRVLTQSDISSVHQALEKLLDDVTPYYKARIETLPTQQRKLLEYVTRAAAQTYEGISPTELAKSVHLPVNQVSSQLRRLVDTGFLDLIPLRGRTACYCLSEPLYALWHQMRLNPETRTKKLVWLVNFLRDWYDDWERLEETNRLYQLYQEYERSGDGERSVKIVQHLHLLAQSARSTPIAGQVLNKAVRSLVRLRGEHFQPQNVVKFSDNLLTEQLADVEAELARNPQNAECWSAKGYLLLWEKNEYKSALECFEHALELKPDTSEFLGGRGLALDFLKRYSEALVSYDRAVALDSNDAILWGNRGVIFDKLDRYSEALESYDSAVALDSNDAGLWNNRGFTLNNLGRHLEALESYDQAVDLEPDEALFWNNRGVTLNNLGRYGDALVSLDRALELDPQHKLSRKNFSTYGEDGFFATIFSHELEEARTIWELLQKRLDEASKKVVLKRCLMLTAELGHFSLARELIEITESREEFFLIDRAIAYLQNHDESLLKKLSPEVREAVQVILQDLEASWQRTKDSKSHPIAQVRLAIDDDYIAKRGHLVHEIGAIDSKNGREAYYLLLVPQFLRQSFEESVNKVKTSGSIDLNKYGRIIASCYGKEPTDEIKTLVKTKYDFSI